jgi:hypothetical protein
LAHVGCILIIFRGVDLKILYFLFSTAGQPDELLLIPRRNPEQIDLGEIKTELELGLNRRSRLPTAKGRLYDRFA